VLREEVDRLRTEKQQAEAEIQRLQSEVDRLQSQLADRQQSQQAMVDRYERVIAELETAAATAPATQTGGPDSSGGRSAGSTRSSSLVDRLTGWLYG